MKEIKNIAKGSLIILIGIFLSKFLTYIYRAIVARFLGSSDYGLLTLGLAISGFIGIFAALGLRSGVIRYVSFFRSKEDLRKVKGAITSSLKITLFLGILTGLLLFLFSNLIGITIFNQPSLSTILKILAVSIPFLGMLQVFLGAFIGFQKQSYEVISDKIFRGVALLVLTIPLILLGFGVFGATIAYSLTVILTTILAFVLFEKKTFRLLKTNIKSLRITRDLLKFSWPLTFTYFFGFVISYMDTLMLGYFRTSSEVGIYNTAIPTAGLFLIPAVALFLNMISSMTSLYAKKKTNEFIRVYKAATKWIFMINFPLFLFFITFPAYILVILFGNEYAAGAGSLIILAFGYLFYSAVTYPSAALLSMAEKTKFILYSQIVAAVLNFILNIFLIVKYGMIGAAIATSISLIIGSILFLAFAYKYTKVLPDFKNYIKPVIAGIISLLVVIILAPLFKIGLYTVISLAVLYSLAYVALMYAIKGFDKDDIIIFKGILNRIKLR